MKDKSKLYISLICEQKPVIEAPAEEKKTTRKKAKKEA